METKQQLLIEITDLTLHIETNYPELYIYLDENPMTIPTAIHPEVDEKSLRIYLETLKSVLDNYIEKHI
ncbi:MAG: hypothetical protein R2812_10310 [Gelidibacter sp.]